MDFVKRHEKPYFDGYSKPHYTISVGRNFYSTLAARYGSNCCKIRNIKHTLPIAYVPFAATVNQDIKALIAKSTIVSRYAMMTLLAYRTEILNKTKKAGGTVDSLDISKFMRFQVPVPPQPEQERIVAILDKFDALVNDISSGLPAELEMRRKQYEYYRDRLLTFPKKKA